MKSRALAALTELAKMQSPEHDSLLRYLKEADPGARRALDNMPLDKSKSPRYAHLWLDVYVPGMTVAEIDAAIVKMWGKRVALI